MAKRTKTTAAKTKRTAPRTRTGRVPSTASIPTAFGTERTLTKPQMIAELAKSTHGNLAEYAAVGLRAAKDDPDFFAHLIAWNERNGEVRDSKVALPCLALAARPSDPDYVENALAHLAGLPPFMFVRGLDFLRQLKAPSRMTRRLVKRYLRDLEADQKEWEWAALQHNASLHELYAKFGVAPGGAKGSWADTALMKNQAPTGKLAIKRALRDMDTTSAAGAIARYQIPFKIARGALGAKAKEPDMLLALVNAMSPADVVQNAKALQKWGVMDTPACRAAFEEALKRVAEAKTQRGTLKTSVAAKALSDAGHTKAAEKLQATQEKQLDKLKGVEGDWLVAADCSGSMQTAIETAREITATLVRMVKGKVHLVFFNDSPRYFEATGKTLEELKKLTKGVVATGGTVIGCSIDYIASRKIHVDGIVLVSDGADHSYGSDFAVGYKRYVAAMGNEPSAYFYKLKGEPDSTVASCQRAGIDLQVFDLTKATVDYYSLPNLVQTMRVGKYGLLDDVLETELKTLDQVLKRTVGYGVVNGTPNTATV